MAQELKLTFLDNNIFELSKKEIKELAKKTYLDYSDAGEVSEIELISKVSHLKEYFTEFEKQVKSKIEPQIGFGVEVIQNNGRKIIQYELDDIHRELSRKLKQREELLKVALSSDAPIYDADGVEVPKVKVKYASDSITIKY